MKKIINEPGKIVEEMLQGIVKSYGNLVHQVEDSRVIARNDSNKQVGLVSGGGSGHEPAHAGFVGDGMLNAAVLGDVFTSPTPDQILTGIQAADQGAGVLLIVKNYTGDILNFEMAKDMADMEDIHVEMVVVDDDIAVEDSTYTAGKRGVAGTVLVHKILGHHARQGASLEELVSLGEKIVSSTKTIGVALKAATVPEVGKPGFTLPEDEIEFGVGIHGEPGYRREKIQPSKELAKELVEKTLSSYEQQPQTVGVLVNGMGGTPLMEQFVFMNDVLTLLEDKGVQVTFHKVGNYMTSIDMQGLSLTMIDLATKDWQTALESNVTTISWLDNYSKVIEEKKDYLSELDTPIGDGDHGNNMARGMAEYKIAFDKKVPTTITETFKVLSMALISKVGGASGPLYGTAFMNMTKATKDLETISSPEQLKEIVQQGLAGIQMRGKAEPGDKTMVDVWAPVAEVIGTEQFNEEKIEQFAEATKDWVAKKGRASYLGERAIGHIDPGAASSALLFEELVKVINQ